MEMIFVIGDILLDKYDYCSNRHNPESSAPCFTVEKTEYKLGGAGNVAANLSTLGSKVCLLGTMGDDKESGLIKNLLKDLKIENNIIFHSNRKTILKERTLSLNDHRYHFRKDTEKKYDLLEKEIDHLLSFVKKDSIVVISDYAKGTISKKFMEKLKERTSRIIVDPKPVNLKAYKGVFLITPNLTEANEMSNELDFEKAGNKLMEDLNTNVLLKRSEKGVSYFGKNRDRFDLPTVAKDVFDVTGAGDTVIATFAHFFNLGKNIKESVLLANKAAGISVSHSGCYQIKDEELI
jgi:rfaE bifunctional protein kinase chain/domain